MAEFDEWARLEGLHPRNLLAEVGVPGPFEMMRSDGMLRQCRYALPESKLAVLDDVALDVRGSELCIGPKGTLLKPHQWHYRLFPPRSPLVINRGTRAVSLRRASHVRVISQPTLVLANNDCYKTPNYFHWTLLILSRIHWSLRHGLLDQRLLAMPSEIRPYMRESLALIGVSEQMMLQYDHTDDLRFSNAALLSPIEFASETLSLELREAMWKAVGASAEEGGKDDGAFLFLVRKDQPRRMIFDFEKVCDLAESLGFTLLAPEDYSVADQVRIFSRAKGIAGPAGAAFTNILYCQPGTKILALTKEEVAAPTFIDLSLALGLRYRWCLGQSEPHSLAYVDILGGAYRIDLQVLEKNLRWMIDDAA